MARLREWVSGVLLLLPIVGVPCDEIGEGGKRVTVTSETAIIVWDAKAHIERFTRLANFETDAKDLGFLVPTPSQPTLAKANQEAFGDLKKIVENHIDAPHAGANAMAAADTKPDSPVLSVTDVGGYEATVLSLANPSAVDGWLKSHGFPKTGATSKWLAPYEQKHWVLTAFRVIANGGAADLNPVQMTFHADVPFYPYREPPAESDARLGRSLRVFFLADAPVEAQMAGSQWVAKREVSVKMSEDEIATLQFSMPGVALDRSPWLTSFIDTSSPRIGTDDVYFTRQATIPTTLIIVLIVIGNVIYFGLRARGRGLRKT